jgi:hypothetical protein
VYVERSAQTLPIRGNLVAISFRSASAAAAEAGVQIEATFHTASGWSSWEQFDIEADEGPDPSSAEAAHASKRVFTHPIWVGTADRMAFRLVAHAGAPEMSDLRAHVINTLGDASRPSLLGRIVGAVSRFLGGSRAEAWPSQPTIITRAQWGADESWRTCCVRYAPSVEMAFIHHTAGTNSYSCSDSAAIVRSIYRFHTKTRGWSDIGYNFLIDRCGNTFEGRYGGITSTRIGAHVLGFNTGTTGISLMGNFQDAKPTTSMVTALKRLLAWKLDVHHVPADGTVVMVSGGNPKYPAGKRVNFHRISGHRDGQQTACPGTYVYQLLPSIRTTVAGWGLPKIYLPTVSSPFLRPDGDAYNEAVTLKATLSGTMRWGLLLRDDAGNLLRAYTNYTKSISVTWNGLLENGSLAPEGIIHYTFQARSGNAWAREATGTFYLITSHPDGSAVGSPSHTIVIENGKGRAVPTELVLNSWYRQYEAVHTGEGEIGRYPAGAGFALRDGTLLSEPDGGYSIISGGLRRPFAAGVYTALGYTSASALPITAAELATLSSGTPVIDTTRHPAGAIVGASDGSEWTIGVADRTQNATSTVRRSWYRDAEEVPALPGDLALPAAATKLTYRPGTMFKLADGTYWLFSDGVRRRFDTVELLGYMGYRTSVAFAISAAEASSIPTGPVIV